MCNMIDSHWVIDGVMFETYTLEDDFWKVQENGMEDALG